MTMLNRTRPDAPLQMEFTPTELDLRDQLIGETRASDSMAIPPASPISNSTSLEKRNLWVIGRITTRLLCMHFLGGRQRAGLIWWLEWDLNPHGIAPNGF